MGSMSWFWLLIVWIVGSNLVGIPFEFNIPLTFLVAVTVFYFGGRAARAEFAFATLKSGTIMGPVCDRCKAKVDQVIEGVKKNVTINGQLLTDVAWLCAKCLKEAPDFVLIRPIVKQKPEY